MTWQIGRYAPLEYSQGELLDKSPLLFWFNHFAAEYIFSRRAASSVKVIAKIASSSL